MAKPNIDKTLSEERMRILLELKNDLRRNMRFKVSGVANKEQSDALVNMFNAIDGMIAADARFLTSDEYTLEQHR